LVITIAVISLATVVVPLYISNGQEPLQVFISAAAFPTLIKKLVDTPQAK
jgi:hypothetical protein